MNESCWKGYKQIGMKKKGGRTVPNCVKENKFSFAEWLNENKEQYQGDSNPIKAAGVIKEELIRLTTLICVS